MQKVICLVLLSVTASWAAEHTNVGKCNPDQDPQFLSVSVSTSEGVCIEPPCRFIRGQDVTAHITFDAPNDVEAITSKCNATALGVTVQFPLPNSNQGCDLITNTNCPLAEGERVELNLVMPVLKLYPKVDLDLVFYLQDEHQQVISCFTVAAKVVDPAA